MQTHPRILRTHVDNRCHNRPPLTAKQHERQEFIIAATQSLMVSFSGNHLTIATLALALRTTQATIRRYFLDIDSILAEILVRHLDEVFRAIGKIPQDHPNRSAAQRAAYREATRTGWGAHTEPHQLLIQKRHTLPDDLAKPIEDMRQMIGEALAGDRAETAFTLLDAPHLTPAQVESMLAASGPIPSATQDAKPAAQAAYKPHYRDWKAARRQKSLQAQAARAAALNNSS